MSRAVYCISNGEPQQLILLDDEQRLSDRFDSPDAQEYALEILHEQGRVIPPPPITSLEPFDRHVLTAVYQLRGNGDLSNINDRITRETGTRGVSISTTSTAASLKRLERLGLIQPWYWIRDGCFNITIGGKRALAKSEMRSQRVN